MRGNGTVSSFVKKMKQSKIRALFAFVVQLSVLTPIFAQVIVDGSPFYGLKDGSVKCEVIPCVEKYKSFVGTWTGPFQSYDRTTKSMVDYQNTIFYENKCYKNLSNNDIFIVGVKKDVYADKVSDGLIITGMKGGNEAEPFLRMIDKENGVVEYTKAFTEKVGDMSIWKYEYPASGNQPAMLFTIVDFRDLLEEKVDKRIVFVNLIVGAEAKPFWKGTISKGFHTKAPLK